MKTTPPDWLISNVNTLSGSVFKTYLMYLTTLGYYLIAIAGTSDKSLILNESTTLPLLNISVSATGFYLVTPILILLIFSYLSLQLLQYRQIVNDLENDYENQPKRQLISILFDHNVYKGNSLRSVQGFIHVFAYNFLMPLAFVMSGIGFMKKHDPVISYLVLSLPLLATCVIVFFRNHLSRFSSGLSFYKKGIVILIVASVLTIGLMAINFQANSGKLYIDEDGYRESAFLSLLRVDLSHEILITARPKEYDTSWGDLEGVHLEGADLTYSIFKQANLSKANLNGSNLKYTTLRGANLSGADLRYAAIDSVDFSYAKMRGIRIQDTLMLCESRTFYAAKMDPEIKSFLEQHCPIVFTVESQDW